MLGSLAGKFYIITFLVSYTPFAYQRHFLMCFSLTLVEIIDTLWSATY